MVVGNRFTTRNIFNNDKTNSSYEKLFKVFIKHLNISNEVFLST